ncbi:hypothetical protein IQ07DRAFT_585930 [Pyrenochaeta sp. DS3sAY3a]|nr:hypothetical protein IQ07DRAFT_585930 [Pyrenochaeta sp. DS3sAY3a]
MRILPILSLLSASQVVSSLIQPIPRDPEASQLSLPQFEALKADIIQEEIQGSQLDSRSPVIVRPPPRTGTSERVPNAPDGTESLASAMIAPKAALHCGVLAIVITGMVL